MGFILSTAVKDLRRHRRDPMAFFLWVGIPLVIGSLVFLASGGKEGPKPQARLLVVDEDNGIISRLLIGALSQESVGGFIHAEEVGREEGMERMAEGDATALLVIPEGFGSALLVEEPDTLELITNPSQQILPGMIEESLRILVDASFYMHRLIGEDLREFAAGPAEGMDNFPDERIAEFSVKMNRLFTGMEGYLSPPLIDIETRVEEEEKTEEKVNLGALFLPGILFMALLFMAQGISADLWEERKRKTLHRAVISPHSVLAFLSGKVLAGLILIFIVCLISLTVGFIYLGLDPATLPVAVIWSTVSGTLLVGMLTLVQLLASSQRAGNILTMTLIFPLMMIGGSFFPFEVMPDWMASIGRLTPNGWALEQLKSILLERIDPHSIGSSLLGILVVTFLLFMICGWRLRTRFVRV